MSDKNLNKNTLLEVSLGSKDKNVVEGMQVDKISKSEINNIVQTIYSNPSGLELILTNIITRIEKLEKKTITNNSDKKNKYRNYVPLKLATIDIHPDIMKIINDTKKIKIVYDQEILNQYEYIGVDRIMGFGSPLIKRTFNPKCIMFIQQNYYPEFKKIIDNIKEFEYFS